jgi:6-phosphogluconolactonase
MATRLASAAAFGDGTTVACTANASVVDIFVGTFTNKASKGIYRTQIDLGSGTFTQPAALAAEAVQPSWLRWHPKRADIMYAVCEDGTAPGCSAYRLLPDGSLQLLNTVSTQAGGPTHFSVSPSGGHLAIANYGGGALTVIPTAVDGSLLPASAVITHEGSGPNTKRQKEPHAHSANWDNSGKFIFCCDLGTDEVIIYELLPSGSIERRGAGATAPGTGPRHLVVHPTAAVVYMNGEMLPCEISVYDWSAEAASLTCRQTVPTLPDGYDGSNGTSELLLNSSATKLYCANRGHDSLVVYDVAADGALSAPLAHVPTGKHPRNFNIDPSGQWLLVGNAHDDTVTVYLAMGGKVIKCPSPLNVLKDTCNHSWYVEHAEMNTST